MQQITADLRRLIEAAVAEGIGMDDIEHELLEPMNLPRDEHDVLWLYAHGRTDFPHHRTIPIVAG